MVAMHASDNPLIDNHARIAHPGDSNPPDSFPSIQVSLSRANRLDVCLFRSVHMRKAPPAKPGQSKLSLQNYRDPPDPDQVRSTPCCRSIVLIPQ